MISISKIMKKNKMRTPTCASGVLGGAQWGAQLAWPV